MIATALTEMFGLQHPIVLGPMGGVSGGHLAATVSNAGGLGLVGGDFHTDNEWIDLTSLTPRLYLFTRLLMEMGTNPPKR